MRYRWRGDDRELVWMAKRIDVRVGDWLVLKPLKIEAVWEEDERLTVEINGQRITMRRDNRQIDKVIKNSDQGR